MPKISRLFGNWKGVFHFASENKGKLMYTRANVKGDTIISGDGHYILIDDIKGKAQVWKTADWKLLAEFQKPKGVSFFSSRVQELCWQRG
ncbi:MAG: hypothetical protein H6573_28230 [Lewinellaceae bacterium]|nr:hypothetical protein [Lewinellaceae bacterium]